MFFKNILLHKDNPLKVQHYSFRRENQERGYMHDHMVLWTELSDEERDAFNSVHDEDVVESSVEVAELVILRSCRA